MWCGHKSQKACSQQELEEAWSRSSSKFFGGRLALETPSFQICGLQNCEKINIYFFSYGSPRTLLDEVLVKRAHRNVGWNFGMTNQCPPTIKVNEKATEFTALSFYTFYNLYHDIWFTCFSCLLVIKNLHMDWNLNSVIPCFIPLYIFRTFSRKISLLKVQK